MPGSELNPEQLAAVESTNNTAILACPGSGKTHVLTEKAARLLKSDSRSRVVAVTFTNDAAKELLDRIRSKAGEKAVERIQVGTFHSLAKAQIETAFPDIRLNILDEDRAVAAMYEAWEETGRELDWITAVESIGQYKSVIDPPQDDSPARRIYDAYMDVLRRRDAIDFSDLLINAVKGLRDGTIPSLLCDHILVDEFQDTDAVQYEWLKHNTDGKIVTVVGDDDQTIYGWRHARGYEGMQRFIAEFNARTIILGTNYRSHAEILESADRLIRHNVSRFDKTLHAARGHGGRVEHMVFGSYEEEIEAIAAQVRKQPTQWAVLARTNRLLDELESLLFQYGIPYYRRGGKRFMQRFHNHIYVDLIEAVCRQGRRFNHGIDAALSYAGLDAESLERLHQACGGDYIEGLITGVDLGCLVPDHRKIVSRFIDHLRAWRDALRRNRIGIFLNGPLNFLVTHAPRPDVVASDLRRTAKILETRFTGSMAQRITRLKHRCREEEETEEGVALYTIHKAKGLEFPRVWMLGCDDKSMPHERTLSHSEERRLFYVGMTRARNQLYLSWHRPTPPSRFLIEAGILETRLGAGQLAANG